MVICRWFARPLTHPRYTGAYRTRVDTDPRTKVLPPFWVLLLQLFVGSTIYQVHSVTTDPFLVAIDAPQKRKPVRTKTMSTKHTCRRVVRPKRPPNPAAVLSSTRVSVARWRSGEFTVSRSSGFFSLCRFNQPFLSTSKGAHTGVAKVFGAVSVSRPPHISTEPPICYPVFRITVTSARCSPECSSPFWRRFLLYFLLPFL